MKALMFASVASMVDLFNRDNIDILEELGYEVTVACNFKEGSVYSKEQAKKFMKELEVKGYDVLNVPVPRSISDIGSMIRSYRILRKDMSKKQYDIIHCQSPIGGVLCRMAAYPARKLGSRVLYFAHGFHFFAGAPVMNWLIYYNIEKFCSGFTDCVLTLNKEDYIRAKRHFKTRVEYIPGAGLDVKEIMDTRVNRAEKCRELNIPEDKKIILSVGELSRRKNSSTAIKAFIKAARDDSILLLCGVGPQYSMLKELVYENHVQDRVFFAGFRNDIAEIIKISDMFIFTSRQEGLPVAVMQAMAGGLPVLCSKIRGNTDLIKNGRGGYMYDCEDECGFAEGINRILDNKKACDMMGQYNMSVIARYDKTVVNDTMRKIYLSLGEHYER